MGNRIRSILFLFAMLLLAGPLSVYAETVSQKEAKHIATQFFNAANGRIMAPPKYVYNGRRLTTNSLFPPFYVFNHPAGGFVVISAENKAFPILGYNLKENFDPDKLSSSTKDLLRLYAIHIENIRYDSSATEDAVRAWGDIPRYIAGILEAPYKATDPVTTREEALAGMQTLLDMYDASAFASATYYAGQWQDMINMELTKRPDVVVGIVRSKGLTPVVIYGRKGDYYRMDLGNRDASLWRLLPTEILSKGQVALLDNPPYIPQEELEDEPHQFYYAFVSENEAAREAAQRELENKLKLSTPVIQGIGGGHFTVSLPEYVREMRVYSLDGTMVQRDKFRDTNVAAVNLSGNPTGFYFAVFFGESGSPYAFKVFR